MLNLLTRFFTFLTTGQTGVAPIERLLIGCESGFYSSRSLICPFGVTPPCLAPHLGWSGSGDFFLFDV